MFSVPVALIAAALATSRTRALRAVTGADGVSAEGTTGPKPATALLIAAVVLAVALAGFAVMIVANVGPPR
jgi:hypothetical protein